MTTIAFDGRTIAADGMRTWGSEIRGLSFQKLRTRGGCIFGFTGLAPLFDMMIDWHLAGAHVAQLPQLHGDNIWTLIIIDREGLGKYTNTCPYVERFEPPIAFGAGDDYAMGAMLAGADARRAIEIVSGLCNHTGGKIQVIDVPAFFGKDDAKSPLLQEAGV